MAEKKITIQQKLLCFCYNDPQARATNNQHVAQYYKTLYEYMMNITFCDTYIQVLIIYNAYTTCEYDI